MAVFVTGDIHGNPVRLSKDSFYEQKNFSSIKDENMEKASNSISAEGR